MAGLKELEERLREQTVSFKLNEKWTLQLGIEVASSLYGHLAECSRVQAMHKKQNTGYLVIWRPIRVLMSSMILATFGLETSLGG
jgi:hypothetical protein